MSNQKLARAIKRARARGYEPGWYVFIHLWEDRFMVMQSPQEVNPAGMLNPDHEYIRGPMKLLEATALKKQLSSEEAERQRSSVPVT